MKIPEFTNSCLAHFLNVTKRTVQRRAAKEKWPYEEKKGLGGQRRVYDLESLPKPVKQKVLKEVGVVLTLKQGSAKTSHKEHAFFGELEYIPKKEELKDGLLQIASMYADEIGEGKVKGMDKFCRLYNDRCFALNPLIYKQRPKISRPTLLRHENKLQADELKGEPKLTDLRSEVERLAIELLEISRKL